MSLGLNASSDFSVVFSETEQVSLYKKPGTSALPIEKAARGPAQTQATQAGGATAALSDLIWRLQMPDDSAGPSVGDTIVDGKDQAWVVLNAEYSVELDRWKVTTRSLKLAGYRDETVYVERPVLEAGALVGWQQVEMVRPGRVVLESIEVDDPNGATPVVSTVFNVILPVTVELEPGDRFVSESGQVYLLMEVQEPGRIDTPTVVRVVPETS